MGLAALLIQSGTPVAVLGASGFLGSHLVEALLAKGCRVRALGRNYPGLLTERMQANPLLTHRRLDLSEGLDLGGRSDLDAALEGIAVCFHLSSTTVPSSSNLDPHADVSANLLGSLRMLEAARRQGVQRIVFTSSGGTVYGIPRQIPIPEVHPTEPTCSYGISKLAIEKYLALYRSLHSLDSIALRVANPYGERQRAVAAQGAVAVFLNKAMCGEAIEIWGDGSVIRDYVYVGEVVHAMLAAADYKGSEQIFNIGSGIGLSLRQLVEAIGKELGSMPAVVYQESRRFDVPANVLDISLARRELGWEPVISIGEGLTRMRAWIEAACWRG